MGKRAKVLRRGPEPGQDPVIRGDRVRELRLEAGLSLRALAIEADTTERQLSDVELGKRDVSLRTFARLVRALDTTADYLLEPR